MSKTIDRIFGWLLVIGGCGHTFGTFATYQVWSQTWLWSLGTALACFLVAALNLMRVGRPHDTTLVVIAILGTIGWILLCLGFGVSLGDMKDPKLLTNFVIAIVLVFFGARTLFCPTGSRGSEAGTR